MQWTQVYPQIDSICNNTKFLKQLDRPCTGECKEFRLCPFCTAKKLREFRKLKFKSGDILRISKYDLPFRKGYKPQFTPQVFEKVTFSSKKPPTYTIEDERDEIIRGKFYQKDLIKVI